MLLGAWVCVVTALLLVIPGAAIGRRMSLSWPVALVAGPPLTLAVVGIATVVYGAIGFEWNPVTALLAWVGAFAVAWIYHAGIRRWAVPKSVDTEPDTSDDPPLGVRAAGIAALGPVLGGVIIAVTCIRPLVQTAPGGLNNIPQIWDALWHASSLRWIHETGVGSSLRMGELMNYDTHGFNYYPNTWHALGALEFDLTSANTVELYNTYSPATLAVTVPLGVAALAYWCARHRFSTTTSAYAAGLAAAIAAPFPSLPYVEVSLTSVPNAVGVSLAPVAAVLTISAVGDRRRILPAALAVAGVTATHPSGLILIAVIVGLWWLVQALWRPVHGRVVDAGALALTGVLALVAILPVIYGTMRIADNNELSGFEFRDETAGVGTAVSQALFNATVPISEHRIWWLVGLAVLGLVVMIWARCWAAIAAWAVFVLLTANSVVALGPLSGPLGTLGGYFYNSGHRLTFVTAMFSAAAAGLAVGVAGVWVADRFGGARSWTRPVVFVVLLALVAGAGVWRYPSNALIASKNRHEVRIGPDDLAAYAWLDAQPGAHDGLIMNNLDQGTGWIYPVTGLTPMFPFYRANDFSERQRDLFWGVDRIGADPHIDAIVRDMNVQYVIDSPPSYWGFQHGAPDPAHGHQGDPFLALRRNGAPGLTEVFRQGSATVYRVTLPQETQPAG
ncbi:DUF6541 family protein [Gordonia sp. NB41Y]|uniref:DUF6541 family protein n=1 Tax=Gordonia sp. NB41Y TaxID=875808 RepID=UPI00034A37AB|nr:DUF6541 family protein [Gordonia sp. NB41Y]EMP15366.2 hypothetical protein ISGA_1655 [Gordonia sp. NB41Y]WLP92496.1 hypothetical protein Q9K23_09810 [Gordonia sp. NB41Y]